MAKSKKENLVELVEICRSFSFHKNLGNYEGCDFFCSEKAEVPESEAEAKSEQLYDFCRKEVAKSIQKFLDENKPPEMSNEERQRLGQEWQENYNSISEEEKNKAEQAEVEKIPIIDIDENGIPAK